ncbi:hypothetical protein L2E71_12185 [Planktothrix agardhii 1032]|nr:hypothetical protein [Planktothrix agardhii 1032]
MQRESRPTKVGELEISTKWRFCDRFLVATHLVTQPFVGFRLNPDLFKGWGFLLIGHFCFDAIANFLNLSNDFY